MRKDEQRLLDALEYSGQPCLPDQEGPDTPVWIYAIAKVRMNNLSVGYAIVRNFISDTPVVIKIFGDAAVVGIDSIHPYKFLDKKYIPELKSAKDAKDYVAKVYGLDGTPNIKKEEAIRLIYAYAAECQLKDEREKQNRI